MVLHTSEKGDSAMKYEWKKQIETLKANLEKDPKSFEQIKQKVADLAKKYPSCSWLLVEIGGIFDSNGFEHEACTWYERGLDFGFDQFPQDQAPHFCVWYGSTLRNVSRFVDSERVIRKALERWPQFSALQFFLGLTLMSQGRTIESLNAFASLSVGSWDNSVQDYRRPITSYFEEELIPAANKPCLSVVRMTSTNVRESAKWYGDVFQTSPRMIDDNFALLGWGTSTIEFAAADEKNPMRTGGTIAYWYVSNLNEWQKKLESAGATLYRGPLEIREENLIICQMKDPFGGVFGLRSKLC
jgi:hypothetical protein